MYENKPGFYRSEAEFEDFEVEEAELKGEPALS